MNYNDVITIETRLPSCGCTSADCFDYGTRILIQVKKTEIVEVEPYYSKKKGDIIFEKRKPGLEFYKNFQSYYSKEEKWDTNLFGSGIIDLRIQFNEEKKTIKISHSIHDPDGYEDCDTYCEEYFQEETDMLNKLLTI